MKTPEVYFILILPSPLYPVGQGPHTLEPIVFVHWTLGEREHPPLLISHSLMSLQKYPLPENPGGHGPQ